VNTQHKLLTRFSFKKKFGFIRSN